MPNYKPMIQPLKVLILAGNTLRARAYAQQLPFLNKEDFLFEGILFGFEERNCTSPLLDENSKKYFENENIFIPDLNENLSETFTKNNWPYEEVSTTDVNSDTILELIKQSDCDLIVFAGYGGQILKKEHFEQGKKYLHMHPGKLPIERGSTTFYYSILNKRNLTVTAFYMTEKIDAGENVLFKEYVIPPQSVDIDRWVDNVIRADCFKDALYRIKKGETFGINNAPSEEYYVIHPVLKHIALLSLKEEGNP